MLEFMQQQQQLKKRDRYNFIRIENEVVVVRVSAEVKVFSLLIGIERVKLCFNKYFFFFCNFVLF